MGSLDTRALLRKDGFRFAGTAVGSGSAGLGLGATWRLPLDKVVSARAADPEVSRTGAAATGGPGKAGRYDVRGRKADPVFRVWKIGRKSRAGGKPQA